MKTADFFKALVIMTMAWTLVGCAGKGGVFEVPAGTGEKEVSLKASSFAFDPAVIKAQQGDVLLLKVENLAVMEHNLTIKNPAGGILQSVTLPAGKTVTVPVTLAESGTYALTCDRPMHTTLGMSGRIEVAPQP
jgi:plastocyanin